MAEMPRKMYGFPCEAPALLLCAYLWGWVRLRSKLEGGGPHWCAHSVDQMALARDVDKRTVEKYLRQLRQAGLVLTAWRDNRFGVWLLTPSGWEDENQPPDRLTDAEFCKVVVEIADRSSARSIGDRRAIDRGSPIDPVHDRSEIADRSCRDRRSVEQGSPIDPAGPKEEQVKQVKQDAAAAAAHALGASPPAAAAAAAEGDLRLAARELLTELAPQLATLGVPRPLLASDRRTVDLLARLLAVDVPADRAPRWTHVRDTIVAYAAVCSHDAEQAGRWGPEMLSLEVRRFLSPWGAVEKSVAVALQRAAAAAKQAAGERAEQEAKAQREATAIAQRPRTADHFAQLEALARQELAELAERNRLAWERSKALAPASTPNAGAASDASPPRSPNSPDLSLLSRHELLTLRERVAQDIARSDPEQARALSQLRLQINRHLAELAELAESAELPGPRHVGAVLAPPQGDQP